MHIKRKLQFSFTFNCKKRKTGFLYFVSVHLIGEELLFMVVVLSSSILQTTTVTNIFDNPSLTVNLNLESCLWFQDYSSSQLVFTILTYNSFCGYGFGGINVWQFVWTIAWVSRKATFKIGTSCTSSKFAIKWIRKKGIVCSINQNLLIFNYSVLLFFKS